MPNLNRFQGSVSRAAQRDVARTSDMTDIGLAEIDAQAELACSRLDGLQIVTGRAMQNIAMVSQLEGQLGQLVPLAVSRLQAVADLHALASVDIVAKSARKLR